MWKRRPKILVAIVITLTITFFIFNPVLMVTSIFSGEQGISSAPLAIAPSANATIPVVDWIMKIYTWIHDTLKDAQDIWKTYIEPVLRDLASKVIMDYITKQTLDWVSGGTSASKNPLIVNWSQIPNDAAGLAFNSVNSYLESVGAGNLCGPFVPQLALQAYVMNPNQAYLYGGELPISCSFKDFQQNLSNQAHFLESGGWASFDALFDPMNNPDWLSIRLEDYYNRTYAQSVTEKTNDALASSGFLSTRQCVDYGDYGSSSDIKTMCSDPAHANDPICSNDPSVNTACNNWQITTPGDVVGKAVASSITSDQWWAEGIQSFTSVLVTALINKVISKGLSSLSSSDIDTTKDTGTQHADPAIVAQFDQQKTIWVNTYSIVVEYFDSSGHPTLQTWKDVASLAQLGISGTSSTPPCSDTATWQQKYNDVSLVITSIDAMVTQARDNAQKIEQVDTSQLSTAELSQQMQTFLKEYQDFTGPSEYDVFVTDAEAASESGGITGNEKLANDEKTNLTQALSTAPACGSPYSSSTSTTPNFGQ